MLGLQVPRGEVAWERDAAGKPGAFALLSGCSSILQGLRCAISLAELAGEPQPDWELAVDQLGHVIACHPEAFADKSLFAMDWYYPVLGGALRGGAAAERIARGWDTFVVPGLGVRCISDQPWVTVAETCELVLALDACGQRERAREVFATTAGCATRRLVLDRLAVRQREPLPRRTVQLDLRRRRARRRRPDRLQRRRGHLPRLARPATSGPPADPEACGCEAKRGGRAHRPRIATGGPSAEILDRRARYGTSGDPRSWNRVRN